ncbi:GspE/PulE family protein [Pedobacter sp.]
MAIPTETLHLIHQDIAVQYRIVPKQLVGNVLSVYADEEQIGNGLSDELQVVLNYDIALEPLSKVEINRLLAVYYLKNENENHSEQLSAISANDDFLTVLINEAKKLKSSDIHIETFEQKARVRVRIDGMMIERYQVGKEDYPALVNKIKIMANLDIAEKRLPQDGRIHYKHNNDAAFDIRVSVLPTLHGEKVVLRLLSSSSTNIDLNTLGLSADGMNHYMQGVQRPNGIILISGPTGSGKTTTLYATLKLLNKSTRNILTIEDPIEYTLEGINQVQLRENIGLGFASALRTFLRQDPDVIMVGEIRDSETANMAIRAALTGHLVLSTIHTNSAWGTVSRLIDMGIPSFLVANTLNTTVAQRLVRLLCPACKQQVGFQGEGYPKQFTPPVKLQHQFVAKGCSQCYFTGYKGRKAVYEVIPIDAELAFEIKQENMYIDEHLKNRNIKTLGQNAFELFANGETSLEEIFPLLLHI